MALLLLLGFFVLLLMGVPISMAMGAAIISTLVFFDWGDSLYILPTQILEGVNKPSLIAVPFFILAGNLMNAVGMTDRIFAFASCLVGHFRAGLAQVNVLSRGYPPEYAAAITLASGLIGPIIPPSIALVVYSFLSGVSVGRLFLGGVVPGVLVGLSLMIYNRVVASRYNFPREERATLPQVIASGKDGLLALAAPAIILSAITLGFTSATEAGVLACCYSLLVGAIFKTLDKDALWKAVTDTAMMSGVIMIIVGYSIAMGWIITIEGIPGQLAQAFLAITDSKHVFLILTIGLLVMLGCVIENVPLKLMLVPILLPIVDQYGVNRVHFGLVLTLTVLMGHATPPMGLGLYVMTTVSGLPFEKIVVAVAPFLIPLAAVLMLITYVPETVLFLPNLIMGPE
jgi:tripartite ATP-independent transporter DctM subunit